MRILKYFKEYLVQKEVSNKLASYNNKSLNELIDELRALRGSIDDFTRVYSVVQKQGEDIIKHIYFDPVSGVNKMEIKKDNNKNGA